MGNLDGYATWCYCTCTQAYALLTISTAVIFNFILYQLYQQHQLLAEKRPSQ